MRSVESYRRWLTPRAYSLRLFDRMRTMRFNPAFLFGRDVPIRQKVLLVLPHHHEAAKIGGLVRVLLAPDEKGNARNGVHAVVVMPSHRGIGEVSGSRKREDMIDEVNKEALDWAYLIGLDLGVSPWAPGRRMKSAERDLPPETAYERRRRGDQFIYGPSGSYRFFNAWRTYDSGEQDPNDQHVAEEEQRQFCDVIREEDPDIVLLPDQMDPHPSHRTTREITMEALRTHLAKLHVRGVGRTITTMEYASFHLLTPPRYNLWAMVPKEVAHRKTEANKAFRAQKNHDYEMDQIMAERVVAIAAGDEFRYVQDHPKDASCGMSRPAIVPDELPNNITAESYTVSVLKVLIKRGIPVVQETRVVDPLAHFASMHPAASAV